MKRLFDLVSAAIGLALLAVPLAGMALWIKLDSPGPVFFRQERVGRNGRRFRIHKLRTMRVDAERSGPPLTVGQDARVTRAGRFLRGRRLDELPQLIDVLQGDMSLVGPRPDVPRYVELYPPPLRKRVLRVRPGLTDPASLEFRDESERLARASDPEREYLEVILPAKLLRSADYADRATFWSDLHVLARTLRVLVSR